MTKKTKKYQGVRQDWLGVARSAFDRFKPLYPSFADFLNYIRGEEGDGFLYTHRPSLTKFYFSQEIVQVFQPPPTQYMLKREKGYYPKLIAFYPFERLYCDTGKIIIYTMTRKEARKKDTPDKILVQKVPDKVSDKILVQKPVVEGVMVVPKEARFPPELRNIYKTGKQRIGASQIKADSPLAKNRSQYILQNASKFTAREIQRAQKGFFLI
jgi:hypothetical protein